MNDQGAQAIKILSDETTDQNLTYSFDSVVYEFSNDYPNNSSSVLNSLGAVTSPKK